MLDEALEYLTQGMFGENNGFNGKYYQLDNVPILPSAKGEVPIIIGGGGTVSYTHLTLPTTGIV